MAAGLPVVVSDIDALHEVVGNPGVYADPNNPAEFAEAITDLRELTHSERAAHTSRLAAMAARFPRIELWQCLVVHNEAVDGDPSAVEEIRRLTESLVSRETRDGHWLTACCVVAEAAAAVTDSTSARLLLPALEPYAG
jgi:hypothetical protein